MSTIVEQVLVPSINQLHSLDAHDTTNWDLVIVSGTSLPLACHLCFISGCLPTLLHAVAFSLSLSLLFPIPLPALLLQCLALSVLGRAKMRKL